MAIVFEQIETSVIDAPVSTGADQQRSETSSIDPAEMRRALEVMMERGARLEVS